jgi:hypothetical protein
MTRMVKVYLPDEAYEAVRVEAFEKRVSMSKLLSHRILEVPTVGEAKPVMQPVTTSTAGATATRIVTAKPQTIRDVIKARSGS